MHRMKSSSESNDELSRCSVAIIEALGKFDACLYPDTIHWKLNLTQHDKLYHYCSLEAFYSIIESNCFWLSHPKFMNDLSEHKYYAIVVRDCIEKYIEKVAHNDKSRSFLELIYAEICNRIKSSSIFDKNEYSLLPFIACFSSDGDNLPMWSMYTGKNVGISIGLDFTDKAYFASYLGTDQKEIEISPFRIVPDSCFSDMIYEKTRVELAISAYLDHMKSFYCNSIDNFSNGKKYTIDNINEFISNESASWLMLKSIKLKNINFTYEQETRFELSRYNNADIKYRVKDKFIVPYIEYPPKTKENEKPLIPISSIMISPNAEEPELVIDSIRGFLKMKGYSIDKIDIRQSDIPFKPR